jgi:hypothetical protein
MYKIISNEIIRQFKPYYDPSKYITDENEELPIKDWIQKYRNVIPAKDILWLLLRKEFLSVKDLKLFAVWCAREVLKLIENPDERSVKACNVAERYANGEATKEELLDARDAAAYATDTAYTVVYHLYYAAHDDATDYTAAFYLVAAHAATYAARKIARNAQVDKLLTYFE